MCQYFCYPVIVLSVISFSNPCCMLFSFVGLCLSFSLFDKRLLFVFYCVAFVMLCFVLVGVFVLGGV